MKVDRCYLVTDTLVYMIYASKPPALSIHRRAVVLNFAYQQLSEVV